VGAEVWATDASSDGLDVARGNLAGMGGNAATRVRLAQGDWFDALPQQLSGSVHLLVSNPPYIAEDEPLPGEVSEWEPRDALIAGATGLEDIALIIQGAPRWLHSSGALVMEIAPHQADDAIALASAAGFGDFGVRDDLAGRPRVLFASRLAFSDAEPERSG
jgi:release factor glutamine methyltransferase